MDDKEPMYYLRQDTDEVDLPKKLYIEPTSLCNLNCSMCFRHGWINEEAGHMDPALLNKIAAEISDLSSVEEVFFGGMGEPLFHPDICEMIKALPNDRKKTLLTNGTLLTERCSKNLIAAGISELWVSMDGFESAIYESIRQGSLFNRLICNLESFNQAREGTNVRLCLTFVVTPDNMEQLSKINEFADHFKVDELNISHVIPVNPIKKEDTLYSCREISIGKMRRYCAGKGDTEEYLCPFVDSNAVFVRWDGKVAPCMQLLHNCYTYLYEEKRRITGFYYGNIQDKTLIECWEDPAYKEFRQRVRVFYFPFCTICWGCEDRKENLTDCAYGEGPTCGACLWATGKIFCP